MTEVIRQNGVTIVVLAERYDSLDEEAIERLGEVVLKAASESEPPALLLDLTKTRFIGSRFIGLLVRAWKRTQDRQGKMGLCCVPPLCKEALITTRLYDTLWSSYETREDAISALQ
jgi:anti-sigma B factor antagonist